MDSHPEKTGIKTYRSKIAQLREKKNLTQEELGRRIDVSTQTIRNWESKRSKLSCVINVHRLCEVLDCDPGDLYECEMIKPKKTLKLQEIQEIFEPG